MPQNSCGTPQNIYGPFEQTLFLGCSVMSFSAHMGWNQEVSEVTVQLVQDPCPAPDGSYKIYYDNNLVQQQWTAADPGMAIFDGGSSYPVMGTPVYFRIADFEFSGILQSWTASDGTDGHPVYTVKLSDPRAILEGTQLIIDKYSGSIYSNYNILNVYGYYENIAGFGGSLANANGMPWYKIKNGVSVLTSAVPAIAGSYSNGRLIYRGSTCASGMGVLPSNGDGTASYLVDLSGVPFAPSYYRLSGPAINLLDAISTICADSGSDFYVELLPTLLDGSIYNIITIRTVSRLYQPALGAINTLLSASTNVVNSNHGVELRNENMLNFVIGGPKQRMYTIDTYTNGTSTDLSDDNICPFWGIRQTDYQAIPSQKTSGGEIFFEADLTTLNSQLVTSLSITTANIYENELRAALYGMDEWLSFASSCGLPLWAGFVDVHGEDGAAGIHDIRWILDALVNIDANNQLRGADNPRAIAIRNQANADLQKDLGVLFEFIRSFATEYYGRKYMVYISDIYWKRDSESNQIITSEEVSDGGWVEDGDTILGLPVVSYFSDFLSTDDGRLQAFVKYTDVAGNDLDFSTMSQDDCFIYNGDAYIKVQVDSQLVYCEYGLHQDVVPRAVITLPQIIGKKFTGDAANIGALSLFTATQALNAGIVWQDIKDAKAVTGGASMQWAMAYVARQPDYAAIPFKSNILVYGPWPSYIGAYPGKMNVIYDEGLVPWEYNGTTTMDLAGNQRSVESVTAMYAGEMGGLTVPGYPTLPLGAEISSTGLTFLFENRIASSGSSGILLTPEVWYGSTGPNITNINTEVGPGGIQTTYQMRSFTPQFGRFTKANIERLRNGAKLRAEQAKLFRKYSTLNANAQSRRIEASNKAARGNKQDVNDPAAGTPHSVIVGQLLNWKDGEFRRSVVETESIFEAAWEFAEDYGSKASMSLDGLLRPVSISGDGGLPRFATAITTSAQISNSAGAQPPVTKGTTGSGLYNLDLRSMYLNPLVGPSGQKHGSGTGHDFEILGHGSAPHTGSYTLPMEGYYTSEKQAYSSDYRFFALRGPMVLTGWGYDLDSKPIPNAADTEGNAENGIFTDTALKDTFMDDWLRKPHTWPVGPVDLRFDRKRGVWVSPPTHRLIMGQMLGVMNAGSSGTAVMINGATLYDAVGGSVPYGDPATAPRFVVRDRVGLSLGSGAKFIAYYDPDRSEYYAIAHPNKKIEVVISGGCSGGMVVLARSGIYIPDYGSGLP